MTTLQRLMLQLERDLVAQARFRMLLDEADSIVTNRRREVKVEKARLSRKKRSS
jgi:hypothetical protein